MALAENRRHLNFLKSKNARSGNPRFSGVYRLPRAKKCRTSLFDLVKEVRGGSLRRSLLELAFEK